MTICRFFGKASRSLLGDGTAVTVLGWTAEQSAAGVDLGVLESETNGVGRLAYIFHSAPDVAAEPLSEIQKELGFVPHCSEYETIQRTSVAQKGGREEWFDVLDGEFRIVGSVYVLMPDVEETRDLFRSESREMLQA